MCYMESKMQEQMEAGEALMNDLEKATYKALMEHLGVCHVTIKHGLRSYGIGQPEAQRIVNKVTDQFGYRQFVVKMGSAPLQDFSQLMDMVFEAVRASNTDSTA